MEGNDRYTEDREGGREFTFTSLGINWEPPFQKVTSVAVVPIIHTSSRVVAVDLLDRGLDLPGGHTQVSDVNPLETACRECEEEASIQIENLILVDVIESDYYGNSPEDLTYMLVYAATVVALLPFLANNEAANRVLVRPSEFLHNYRGGDPKLLESWLSKAIQSGGSQWT